MQSVTFLRERAIVYRRLARLYIDTAVTNAALELAQEYEARVADLEAGTPVAGAAFLDPGTVLGGAELALPV